MVLYDEAELSAIERVALAPYPLVMVLQRPSGFIEPCLPTKVARPPSGSPVSFQHFLTETGRHRDGGGDAHRAFTAAQKCSVTAAVSSVTFQPFVSAFSLANFCSI